ncbi:MULTISPECIES: sigma-70 family RNA polymerase sigma factor [Catenuloplanes]|uniref:RNA polymerase sigma-70 factor (ECF subfamily) n=1 Tax=Catenuloplanes niger TaxID=587534 RepID=A0AAE3ZVV2_9ACTN|nr:sigma-70 family RNA polymerase sigma factor [Catenuloplanes niger]MDR7325836.1 RNA polymerase sigma-70 factor (ECF subfamily) [Catenuloplanes niger]
MRTLVRANADTLHRYLLRMANGRWEAAEDMLQETMLRAWHRIDDLPAEEEALRRWLFTVARNVAIDASRAQSVRPTEIVGVDVTWIPAAGSVADAVVERQALLGALQELSPDQRTVLLSLYVRDVSVAEAADVIGVPEGTVRSRSFYALRRMRELLGPGFRR